MIGITFGNYHSYDDFDLILSSKSIESPSVKTESIDIPGADSELDFTEFFGEPKYKNRQLKFDFHSILPYSEQLAQDSTIKNALHGQRVRIILDSDPDYYYVGRLDVGTWSNDKNVGKLTITANCEPWKYLLLPTTVTVNSVDDTTVTLNNLRRAVVPKITTNADIILSWEGGTVALSAGTWTITDLILRAGANPVTITGAATVVFEYQEASL